MPKVLRTGTGRRVDERILLEEDARLVVEVGGAD
jgi:hypothetical protein